MNMLSILLYFADILPRLGTVFALAAGIALTFIVCIFIVRVIDNAENRGNPVLYKEARVSLFKTLWIPLVVGLLAAAVPSSGTIYAIAASEIAEEGVQSAYGQRVGELVMRKMDEYLAQVTAEAEETETTGDTKAERSEESVPEDKVLVDRQMLENINRVLGELK